MLSSSNGSKRTNGKWERVTSRRTFKTQTTETFRSGERTRTGLSAYYSSESDTDEVGEGHITKVNKYNGQAQISHYSETEDDEGEYNQVSRNERVNTQSSVVVLKVWRGIKSVTSGVAVWIYWALVQSLVFEKWLLNRRSTRRSYLESTVHVPPHACSSRLSLQPAIRRSAELTPVKRSVPWALILFLLASLLLVPSLFYFEDFPQRIGYAIKEGAAEIGSKCATIWNAIPIPSLSLWNNAYQSSIDPPIPPVPPDFEEKIEAKLESKLQELEEIFKQNLAAAMEQNKPVAPPRLVIGQDILNGLKSEIRSYASNLIDRKECTVVCPSPPPPMVSVSGNAGIQTSDVEKLIKVAIEKYDADKTGRPDLALESGGGSIVSTRCTKKSDYIGSQISIWNIPIWFPSNNPRKAIQPGTMPGDCWSFDGAEGFLVIKLVGPTRVSGFTMEHLPKSISPVGHINSAPRKFQVVGHMDYNDPENEFLFGEYEYKDDENPVQYFDVQNESDTFFPYVELKILSNHGSVTFTCLYRFRVHGSLVNTFDRP